MCLSPINIPNPCYGRSKVGLAYSTASMLVNTEQPFLKIGCGHCVECTALKQSYLCQRAFVESHYNDMFFFTLTYNNESLPVLEVNGYKLAYASYDDIHRCIKRMRLHGVLPQGTKYIISSEFGSKKHRPHFHGIFFVPRPKEFHALYTRKQPAYQSYIQNLERTLSNGLRSHWCRNKGTRKNPVYVSNYTHHQRGNKCNFDFHYIKAVSPEDSSNVVCYCTKYMLKFSEWENARCVALKNNLEPDEFRKVWNTIRSRVYISKHFGYSSDYRTLPCIVDALNFYKSVENDPSNYGMKMKLCGRYVLLSPYLIKKYCDFPTYVDYRMSDPRLDSNFSSYVQKINENSHDMLYRKNEDLARRQARCDAVITQLRLKEINSDDICFT